MGDLWRNLDAITTIDPARGFRTAEYTRSALNRRIHLVGYRKRYFVMQLGLRLLLYSCRVTCVSRLVRLYAVTCYC